MAHNLSELSNAHEYVGQWVKLLPSGARVHLDRIDKDRAFIVFPGTGRNSDWFPLTKLVPEVTWNARDGKPTVQPRVTVKATPNAVPARKRIAAAVGAVIDHAAAPVAPVEAESPRRADHVTYVAPNVAIVQRGEDLIQPVAAAPPSAAPRPPLGGAIDGLIRIATDIKAAEAEVQSAKQRLTEADQLAEQIVKEAKLKAHAILARAETDVDEWQDTLKALREDAKAAHASLSTALGI